MRICLCLAGALALAACTAPERRVSEASLVADAGIAFADTLPPLYDAFIVQTIEADSLELKAQRELRSDVDQLERSLENSTRDLTTTIGLVRDLKRHAGLLKSYFVALKDLAGDDVGGQVPNAAKQAVSNLEKLGIEISKKKLGGATLGSLTEPLSAYAVGAARSAALQAELEARGTAINREIARHEQAIAVVADRMKGDRERVLIETIENPLTEEFLDLDRRLPDDWWKRRAEYLQQLIEIDPVTRAQAAARNLRTAWEDLAAGRRQTAILEAIGEDLDAIDELLARLKSARD